MPTLNHRSDWASLVVGLFGLVLTGIAVGRWAPDVALRPASLPETLASARRDAGRLGYRVEGDPPIQITAGPRFYATDSDVATLVEQVSDPAERRRLLMEAPPVRVGVRFWDAVGPEGLRGSLLLEYDASPRLVGASFGWDGVVTSDPQAVPGRELAERLAEALLGEPPPIPDERRMGGGYELVFRPHGHRPGAYVYLGGSSRWIGHRQPFPYPLLSTQISIPSDPAFQLQNYALFGAGLLGLGILLWRLSRRRAGFGHLPALAVLLILGLLPALANLPAGSLRFQLLVLYLVAHAGLLLAWMVGEAEAREVRPGSLEDWDRLVRRRPLAATGRTLVIGVAWGCGFAGLLSAGGRLAELTGGGYGRYLVILPEYWILASPLSWGIALASLTAFLVAFGGRLGGRTGAIVGAAICGLGWEVAMPVTPLAWSLALGTAVALTVGWLMWWRGALAMTVACVTAVSVPTAWIAWSMAPLRLGTALTSSLPLLALVTGVILWRRSPRVGATSEIAPEYVTDLERETRLQAEIDLLRRLQISLLPAASETTMAGGEVAWSTLPADLVGGDFLDLIEDERGRLWIAIADVAGHGISCSMLTAVTKAAVTEHACAESSPARALGRIRRLFERLRYERLLVTLLLAVWDPDRRDLAVANAGHPPLLVLHRGRCLELGRPGRPLGAELAGGDESEERVALPDEAVLVGMTDGVIEAASPAADAFGYERWPRMLPRLGHQGAPEILAALLAAVEGHRAGRRQEDDLTAIVVKLP